MDVHSEERVPRSHLPQLAAWIQRGADHVHPADGKYDVLEIAKTPHMSHLSVVTDTLLSLQIPTHPTPKDDAQSMGVPRHLDYH